MTHLERLFSHFWPSCSRRSSPLCSNACSLLMRAITARTPDCMRHVIFAFVVFRLVAQRLRQHLALCNRRKSGTLSPTMKLQTCAPHRTASCSALPPRVSPCRSIGAAKYRPQRHLHRIVAIKRSAKRFFMEKTSRPLVVLTTMTQTKQRRNPKE